VVELDIEIWPTSIVVPKGHRIGLSIRGKDYVYPGRVAASCRTSRTSSPVAGRSCTMIRAIGRPRLRRHHQPTSAVAAGLSAVAGDPIDKQTKRRSSR
jgi:hypothetical protein